MRQPFLRIPPFPRHRAGALCRAGGGPDIELNELAAALSAARVGGPFWDAARDPWSGRGDEAEVALVRALAAGGERAANAAARVVAGWAPRDPYTGGSLGWLDAVALLAEWRRLIEDNRSVAGLYGIARWKRETLDAMLWDGTGVAYQSRADAVKPAQSALVWAARTPAALLAGLASRGAAVGEIEDGFIRSAGLGANCVAPLSVVVDPLGAHIDPARPSSLEHLLANAAFPPRLIARAAALRSQLVAGGIGKYGAAQPAPSRPAPANGKRRVLVCGQVEDDRSVLLGGMGMTNAGLVMAARAADPNAEIIWRPHPDVEAGHRKGAVPAALVAAHADRIERATPIATLLAQADAVHVISSLAGFEALLRGVEVTTHGLPFYAGWGLTTDTAVPPPGFAARRARRLTLDELVAGVLILYPRYLDPLSRLPCPPEVLVARLAAGDAQMITPLVRARMALGVLRGGVLRRLPCAGPDSPPSA